MAESSSVKHLFDSSGRWIAFQKGSYVFDTSCNWVGWLPWDDVDVVDTNGNYLGTIFPGHRFYRRTTPLHRGYPGYPGYPGYSGYPGYPGFAGYSPRPPLTDDIRKLSDR